MLWGHTKSQKTSRNLKHLTDLFSETCVHLEGESLRHQVDAANVLFTKAMQVVLKDSIIVSSLLNSFPAMGLTPFMIREITFKIFTFQKKNTSSDLNFMDTIKLAVEVYFFLLL